jgi:hypothetical protein
MPPDMTFWTWRVDPAFPHTTERFRMSSSQQDFAFKIWMSAAAAVTAVIVSFLALAFLSPDVNVDLAGVRSGAAAGGD